MNKEYMNEEDLYRTCTGCLRSFEEKQFYLIDDLTNEHVCRYCVEYLVEGLVKLRRGKRPDVISLKHFSTPLLLTSL